MIAVWLTGSREVGVKRACPRLHVSTRLDCESFVELVDLPVFEQQWKDSTKDGETYQIRCHLVSVLGKKLMRQIEREAMQQLLDYKSIVDHLRFRLRSIFKLAVSEGVAHRNPAESLYLARDQLDEMACALDIREHVKFRLATWEGMRPGEILALQFGDVDGEQDGEPGEQAILPAGRVVSGNQAVCFTSGCSSRTFRKVTIGSSHLRMADRSPGIIFDGGTCCRN